MEGSKMEGSKMKCGEGVKEGQSENTGEGGWCCSTNKYGAVSPTSNYLCIIYHHHIVFLIHYTLIVISWSHILQLVTIPIDGSSSVFSSSVFSRHPYLPLSVSAVRFHNLTHPCTLLPI